MKAESVDMRPSYAGDMDPVWQSEIVDCPTFCHIGRGERLFTPWLMIICASIICITHQVKEMKTERQAGPVSPFRKRVRQAVDETQMSHCQQMKEEGRRKKQGEDLSEPPRYNCK